MPDVSSGAATAGSAVHDAASRLESLIAALPQDARREKALYHLERLRMAFQSSHQEAVRFAAFTVNKTVHDAAADWGAEITAAVDSLLARATILTLHSFGRTLNAQLPRLIQLTPGALGVGLELELTSP